MPGSMLPGANHMARRRAPTDASRQQGVATLKAPADAAPSAAAVLPAGAETPPVPASIAAPGSPVAELSGGAESPAAVLAAGVESLAAAVFAGAGLSAVDVSPVAVVKAGAERPADSWAETD